MTPEGRIRAFVSLVRYRSWSVTLRAIVGPALRQFDDGVSEVAGPATAVISYWFASLFVLTEGWQELELGDPVIDRLLTSDHLGVLRRYRNGVCHYQQDFGDARFLGMLTAGADSIRWVKELDAAFDSYFARHSPRPDVRHLASWIRGDRSAADDR